MTDAEPDAPWGAHVDHDHELARVSGSTTRPDREINGRGHALTIAGGWREVADTALAFVQRLS